MTSNEHDARQRLIDAFAKEERMEENMIHLYQSLQEGGAIDCLPQDKRERFSSLLKVLHDQSVEHQIVVFNLIEKYKNS